VTDRRPDEPEIEALQVDRYLESILVARDRGAAFGPYDPDLDPELRSVAERLSAELVRVHPSFRFEERLARRLADVAAAMRLPAAAGAATGAGTSPVPLNLLPDPAAASAAVRDEELTAGRSRPYLIGGALTSAAISLAGAAFVAWRLSRPVDPMTRAIRRAHHGVDARTGLA